MLKLTKNIGALEAVDSFLKDIEKHGNPDKLIITFERNEETFHVDGGCSMADAVYLAEKHKTHIFEQ